MNTSEIVNAMIFGDGGASKIEELSTDGGSTDAGKVLVVGDNGKIAASDLTVGEGEIALDKTLSVNGAAAGAKETGDAIRALNGSLGGLSETMLDFTDLKEYVSLKNGALANLKDSNAVQTNWISILPGQTVEIFPARPLTEGTHYRYAYQTLDGNNQIITNNATNQVAFKKITIGKNSAVRKIGFSIKVYDSSGSVAESLRADTYGYNAYVVISNETSLLGTITTKANMVTGGEIAISWERGGLSLTGDEQENSSQNRVRTGYITGNKLSVKITSNLIEYSLRYYNDAGECIGNDTAFRTVDTDDVFSNFEGTTSIRILARLAGNSNITNENFLTITENLKVIDTGIREQIKNLDGRIPTIKSYYTSEIADTTRKVIDLQTEPCVTFVLVTDIHYKSVNGGAEGQCLNGLLFRDTALNMKAVADGCKLDFVFCNGDFTDGDIEKPVLKNRVKEMMDLFRMIDRPFLCSVGNHDDNRYSSPVSLMNSGEIFANYVAQISKSDVIYGSMNGTNYYFDFANLGIRFIVINSNTFTGSYGYTEETRLFVSNTLASMPEGYQGFLFVHTSPATIMNYNQAVRPNGADLETIINNSGRMCAMFYGHSHQDNSFGASGSGALNVYDYLAICTCCEKCTNTNGDSSKWAPNATMPTRTLGTYTEDLWDVVVIRPLSRKINFVRFGAGSDREFTY